MNAKLFKSHAGDVERLVYYCQMEHTKESFTNPNLKDKVINRDIVKKGLIKLYENTLKDEPGDKFAELMDKFSY
jgi:hypothetical protein